jgi:hypothetical protein
MIKIVVALEGVDIKELVAVFLLGIWFGGHRVVIVENSALCFVESGRMWIAVAVFVTDAKIISK